MATPVPSTSVFPTIVAYPTATSIVTSAGDIKLNVSDLPLLASVGLAESDFSRLAYALVDAISTKGAALSPAAPAITVGGPNPSISAGQFVKNYTFAGTINSAGSDLAE